jgi:hypothetical protein
MERNQRQGPIQIVILIITLGGVVALLNALGAFKSRNPQSHQVTYRVEGTTAVAVVTYTQEDGSSTAPMEVTLPWKKEVRFTQTTPVILTVGNPSQVGHITCILYLDGAEWKRESASAPKDKVSCAGIVP